MITSPTIEELTEYVHAGPDDVAFLEKCRQAARVLVERYITDAPEDTVPTEVLITAQLEVALKLFARRSAPNGVFQDATGGAIYAPRQVMITAAPLLDPFLPVPL